MRTLLARGMPGSQRYPEARQKLFREVENGSLLVSYVGHGGEVGWATERILQLEDINAWENQTTMPVFTTITCEFAKFDDPNRVSAAEQLYLNPNGGAIALFSTTRSVFATNSTYQLNELLNRNMLFLDQPRLGDVIRATKNNNISGDKIKFSLLGDAALPLARPENGLVFDSINGIAWDQFSDTIKALNWVQIKEASATIAAKPLPTSTVACSSNFTTRPRTCKLKRTTTGAAPSTSPPKITRCSRGKRRWSMEHSPLNSACPWTST